VIALRPTSSGERTVMRVRHRVSASGELLTSAVAVHPQRWFRLPPSWVEFEIHVEHEGQRTLVFEQRLDPTAELDDRRWFELEIDLSPWAGEEVSLLFVTESERPQGESLMMAGWWEPRVRALEDGAAEAPSAVEEASVPRTAPTPLAAGIVAVAAEGSDS
jgi:hypothetical protein